MKSPLLHLVLYIQINTLCRIPLVYYPVDAWGIDAQQIGYFLRFFSPLASIYFHCTNFLSLQFKVLGLLMQDNT